MVSADSNRNDPEHVAYFQNFADVFGIFWQFHKERMSDGNIPFAVMHDSETFKHIPFDPTLAQRRWKQNGATYPLKILEHFDRAVRTSMKSSWRGFLQPLGFYEPSIIDEGNVSIPEKQKKFVDPYVKDLVKTVDMLTQRFSKVPTSSPSVNLIGEAAIDNGTLATIQLTAVLGKFYNPHSALALSKTRYEDLLQGEEEIGISHNTMRDDSKPVPRGTYSLLDDSLLGLKRDRLHELGLGDALGCPAAMRMTPATQNFLAIKGVVLTAPTALEDFARMMPGQFDRYIGAWYNSLTPQERQTIIDPEQNRILSGEARRAAIGEKPTPQCPYGKERM